VFEANGVSVMARVATDGTVAWLAQAIGNLPPQCKRWCCDTCQETWPDGYRPSQACIVIQSPVGDTTGWMNWFCTRLEADALSAVRRNLSVAGPGTTLGDCMHLA
jgi:hypothetical protein